LASSFYSPCSAGEEGAAAADLAGVAASGPASFWEIYWVGAGVTAAVVVGAAVVLETVPVEAAASVVLEAAISAAAEQAAIGRYVGRKSGGTTFLSG
jgi:hypothetical protein